MSTETVSSLRPNRVKERFRDGDMALAAYANLGDPALVEIIGLAGFDAATIDLEHVTFHLELVRQMIVAAEAAGIAPIVRIPPGDWDTALRLLDAGAQGIQVSHVRDRRTAEAAVAAVRYPPVGRRGALGISRAARFGAVPWEEFAEHANREILLIVMIEDAEALDRIEDIASVEGIDLVTVGIHDLSESLGIRAPNDPRLRAALEDVARRIHDVGNARMGFTVGHPVLTLTIGEVRDLGMAYANILPPPEVVMRAALTDVVARTRSELNG